MGIQVIANTSFCGNTGYNNHSKNFFTSLNNYIPVRVRNYSYGDNLHQYTQAQKDMIIEQNWNDPPYKLGTPFNHNPNDLKVNIVLNESHHYFFYDQYERPLIFYNVWESTRQFPEFFERMKQADQFWCPTQWQKDCTIDQGYPENRIKVVPEGVNGQIFKPINLLEINRNELFQKYDIPEDTFVFTVFGRWDYRKSTTEMIQAFNEEFKNDEKVMLVLSVDNPFSTDELKTTENRLEHHKINTDKLKILHFPDRKEYIQWLQCGHVFLSCSRSEGWNLPLMEAIACGTPTICSNWSGQLEFADGISRLVNVPNEKSPKEVFMLGDEHDFGVWGEPDFDHLKSVMRDSYNNYNEDKQKAIKQSKDLREEYTWDNAAKKGEKYIKELAKKHFVVKPENQLKTFFVEFGLTEDKQPKITFHPFHLKHYDIKVIVKSFDGNILYQSVFGDLKKSINYWVSVGTPEKELDGITFELFDKHDNLLQTESKQYGNKTPKISFVTSFYNTEAYVDELADSILEQTMNDWEWIITDDWSDDNTKEKIKQLAQTDRRIKYIDQESKQEIYWNPHKYANGDIICTIDADDVIVPKCGEVIAHFYDKYPQVQCLHVNANFHLEHFKGIGSYKNYSFCNMGNYDSILQKHQIYLTNKSGEERIGMMFGVIRSYRNPGPLFDFNDGDFKLGKHEDLVKLFRLEEIGTPLFLNRTLYKVRMRESGSNSGSWKDFGGRETEFEKIREQADKRRTKSFKHLHNYDRVNEELFAFLYSNLNNESEKQKISCFGFNINSDRQNLIKEMYYDHDVIFDEVDYHTDYVFIKVTNTDDIELYEQMTSGLRKAEIIFFFVNVDWSPEFYNVKDSSNYFKLFSKCKDLLASKRTYMWTTYLYKYCAISYKVKSTPIRLNLGCGNDIKKGYVNIDKYNNTGLVDSQDDLGDLSYPDGRVDEIYTSHVFEHIGINDMYGVMEEWRRVLRPNGELIIRIPNLEQGIRQWLNAPDENKWRELGAVFGSQTHTGNSHLCGFNKGSLKHFLESFDFEVTSIEEKVTGHGDEVEAHAIKLETEKQKPARYTCHFVDGPYLQIDGEPTKNYFVSDFLDPDNNSSVHQELMNIGYWTRPHRKYFTNWLIEVHRNGKLDFKHEFNAKGRRILISFDTKSLGDTLAWIPYMLEFKKKHDCILMVSTFWNRLFEPQKQYADLKFIYPGEVVHDLYASYSVGCFDDDISKNKNHWRSVPLQQVCTDFLGLEYKEIVPSMDLQTNRGRKIKEKYVCISEFSTFQNKFWNYKGGWQEIVDYLNDLGYKVVVISKETTKLKNIIDRTNRSMHSTISTIRHCEFYMGVSAGPTWLAWTLNKPTILISGFSAKWGEYQHKIERVINEDVCHGCFNDPIAPIDRGDWNWCPRQKGTHRQFECTLKITPGMVKTAIQNTIKKHLNHEEI